MVHLSYLTLDTLKRQHCDARAEERDSGAMVIRRISEYRPDSEVPVMVTDGITRRLSFGVKQPA